MAVARYAGRGCAARPSGNTAGLRAAVFRHFCAVARAAKQPGESSSARWLWLAGSGAVGASAYCAWRYFDRRAEEEKQEEDDDVELPLVAEPVGHFTHPYEAWPWYRRAWFTLKRSIHLAWVFAPFVCVSTAMLILPSDALREIWLEQMLKCTQRAGAAFLKFGQWLSMRPDMFPPDVIRTLGQLRSDAPSHSPSISRQLLEENLGRTVEEVFEEFAEEPVASGSVGQVHRARMRPEFALDGPGGRLRDVAVKVQHPGVIDSAFMDLGIIWKVVEFSQKFLHMTVPFDRNEFDEVIQAQMDFTREAFNLQKFGRNFKGESRIRFPKVSPAYVTPEVLVETWADGKVISHILEDFDNATESAKAAVTELTQRKRKLQGDLCAVLYDMSMKMMVRDNFVHGDLHGGNILYSEDDDHVTVLDAGIATSLGKETLRPFGNFLHALCSGRTEETVEYLVRFNEASVKVDLPELKRDIQHIMDKYMGPNRVTPDLPVNAADMFGEVMFSMQKHEMLLKGDVASTLFTISISEGLIRQLDPTFDVAVNALPYIVRHMALQAGE